MSWSSSTPVSREPDRLIADLLRDSGERQVQVVMLDARRDGVAQMSETLAHYRELDAVHVLSHGTDGAVQLGASVLDDDSLERYADAIRGWSYSLGEQADLLFYGCNLAAGEDGRALVGDIAALTGADVAASEDLTGSAALGGDWELEYAVGAVDTAAAIDPAPQRAWLGLLDAAALGGEFPVNSHHRRRPDACRWICRARWRPTRRAISSWCGRATARTGTVSASTGSASTPTAWLKAPSSRSTPRPTTTSPTRRWP